MIAKYLPWLLSCLTIFQLWVAGNKTWWAWLMTLGNQTLWFTWICASKNWGLLPMNIAICFVAIRNHRKWYKYRKLRELGLTSINDKAMESVERWMKNPEQERLPCAAMDEAFNKPKK